ncbi:MAG: single-stranded-DNA-specific exonuclease RecJ [Candidatus Pacebacteria bacterium]|nr:single-stranded-DNA-specific exonuclease RecJ [Candidatus Paceibacterota bacterium]MBP9832397.1 single-stranded-DNA-specific exonuclease RecJ [Candidatus Paceibacterota bacterium]
MQILHPLVERILENRKITDKELFLNPLYDARHDPFLLKGMDVAVARILDAIKKKEKICVWHDYDCDGIPGGALLFDFFRRIGYEIETYVPERSEGYGLNVPGIDSLKEKGISLIITVDCGITDVREVAHASAVGIETIVTDHHLPQATLPPALAVINAHQADDVYPFKGLCGTGVAFKLVEALIQKGSFDIQEGSEKWLLDLVAVATVADMVPLTGENRTLVKFGLTVLRKGRRPGLKALLEAERIPLMTALEDDIAFSIAPKINAASRMKSPKLSFELLTTESDSRAREIAKELVQLNQERKIEGMRVAKDVKKRMEMTPTSDSVIVMGSQSWRPSLLGIAATSVVETYQRTVCLWGMDGGLIKGSCRSNGTVNIVSLMVEAKDAFLDFGGHELAGGFSVSPEKIHDLPLKLQQALELITARGGEEIDSGGRNKGIVESSLTLAEVNDVAFDALRSLGPFGMENPKPFFRFHDVSIIGINYFGKAKDHLRLTLADDSGRKADAIVFFVPRSLFKEKLGLLSVGDVCTIEASVERSYFAGRKELRLRVENVIV